MIIRARYSSAGKISRKILQHWIRWLIVPHRIEHLGWNCHRIQHIVVFWFWWNRRFWNHRSRKCLGLRPLRFRFRWRIHNLSNNNNAILCFNKRDISFTNLNVSYFYTCSASLSSATIGPLKGNIGWPSFAIRFINVVLSLFSFTEKLLAIVDPSILSLEEVSLTGFLGFSNIFTCSIWM